MIGNNFLFVLSAVVLSVFLPLNTFGFRLRERDLVTQATENSNCEIAEVYKKIYDIFYWADKPLEELSYTQTLSLTKQLTGLFFVPTCKIPIFYTSFKNFSNVAINFNLAGKVQDDIVELIADVNDLFQAGDDIPFDKLVAFGDRAHEITKSAFQISFRYAPIQALLCTDLLALRYLAAKASEASSTTLNQLKSSLNMCTNGLNDGEYNFMDTLYHVDMKYSYFPFYSYKFVTSFSFEDTFYNYIKVCDAFSKAQDCESSCVVADMEDRFVYNPAREAYRKVFAPGYCVMRKWFSIFETPSSIVAVQAHDTRQYVGQAFVSGDWYFRDSPGGALYGVFKEVVRKAEGITLYDSSRTLYLDFKNGRIILDNVVQSKNVTFLNRCDVGVPPNRGACYR